MPREYLRALYYSLLLSVAGCATSASSDSQPGNGGSSASGGAMQASGGLDLRVVPSACPDAGIEHSDASVCVPLETRSFTRDIVPLFDSCAGEICHSFAAGAIAAQVGVPSVECCGELQMIDPGHPELSYVLRKLRGQNLCGGQQMPLAQAPFSAADLQTVSDWICQGAGTSP